MGPVGVQEMIVIFLVALVLFGPKKLPELGKTIAKAITEFRRAQSDLKATFDREMKSLEAENEALKEATRQAAIDVTNYSQIDLTGGTSGTYSTEPYAASAATDWHEIESGAPTTVSASDVPGAESQGSSQTAPDTSPPALHAADDTVARGTMPPNETVASAAVPAESATSTPRSHEMMPGEPPSRDGSVQETPVHETQNS